MDTLYFQDIVLGNMVQVATQLAALTDVPHIWAFRGDLGAGKSTLIKGLALAMGVQEETTSPTFSLVNEYKTASGRILYHFDFYRINSIEEVYDMGYEDYFYSGNICLIEWPEKIEALLADEPLLNIVITPSGTTARNITVTQTTGLN